MLTFPNCSTSTQWSTSIVTQRVPLALIASQSFSYRELTRRPHPLSERRRRRQDVLPRRRDYDVLPLVPFVAGARTFKGSRGDEIWLDFLLILQARFSRRFWFAQHAPLHGESFSSWRQMLGLDSGTQWRRQLRRLFGRISHGFPREGEPRILCRITPTCPSSPSVSVTCLLSQLVTKLDDDVVAPPFPRENYRTFSIFAQEEGRQQLVIDSVSVRVPSRFLVFPLFFGLFRETYFPVSPSWKLRADSTTSATDSTPTVQTHLSSSSVPQPPPSGNGVLDVTSFAHVVALILRAHPRHLPV